MTKAVFGVLLIFIAFQPPLFNWERVINVDMAMVPTCETFWECL